MPLKLNNGITWSHQTWRKHKSFEFFTKSLDQKQHPFDLLPNCGVMKTVPAHVIAAIASKMAIEECLNS